ncbi:uncharacterized protein LOC141941236 [Strix uralensis]|uniref:uncharacterized protein LOC141941236 n=1 Tax=Strix uralensis TaxID=36305 RepID=UPI003DA703DF
MGSVMPCCAVGGGRGAVDCAHLGLVSPLHSQTASVHPGSACVTPSAGEDSQATGFSEEEEGQAEGRRKKHLTRQILPAVPRMRAAFQGVVGPDDLQEFPSHLKPFCSSGVTAVTSRAVSYHRREKVAPGFKAIPSACCFTPAAALLKKRRRKLWLTKLCHNRDCSRQHHGMLIMTSTGLAELSFSLLLAMDLQWPLIRGKRLYNSKWSYKAVPLGEERRGIVRSGGLKRGAGREKEALDKGDLPVSGAAVARDRCRHCTRGSPGASIGSWRRRRKSQTSRGERPSKARESGGRSGGSLGNKWRQKKGALGNRTTLSLGSGRARVSPGPLVPWPAWCPGRHCALAAFVLGDLPVSGARVFGFLPAFCHVAPWLGCPGRWQASEGVEQHRLRSRGGKLGS